MALRIFLLTEAPNGTKIIRVNPLNLCYLRSKKQCRNLLRQCRLCEKNPHNSISANLQKVTTFKENYLQKVTCFGLKLLQKVTIFVL